MIKSEIENHLVSIYGENIFEDGFNEIKASEFFKVIEDNTNNN